MLYSQRSGLFLADLKGLSANNTHIKSHRIEVSAAKPADAIFTVGVRITPAAAKRNCTVVGNAMNSPVKAEC